MTAAQQQNNSFIKQQDTCRFIGRIPFEMSELVEYSLHGHFSNGGSVRCASLSLSLSSLTTKNETVALTERTEDKRGARSHAHTNAHTRTRTHTCDREINGGDEDVLGRRGECRNLKKLFKWVMWFMVILSNFFSEIEPWQERPAPKPIHKQLLCTWPAFTT